MSHTVDAGELGSLAAEMNLAASEIEKIASRLHSVMASAKWSGSARASFERELESTINVLRMQGAVLKQKHTPKLYQLRSVAEKLGQ